MLKKQHFYYSDMNRIFFLTLLVLLTGCSARVLTTISKPYPPLDARQPVVVLGLADEVPPSCIPVGTIKIGDTGFSLNCGWDSVVETTRNEARKAGANLVKIVDHIPPSLMGSSCDRIIAKIFRVENPEALQGIKSYRQPVVDSSWNYAQIYVYRPAGRGLLVGYDVYLGDSVICTVTDHSCQAVKISRKGLLSLWAKTETKSEIPIDLEYGREYFIRCSIDNGVVVGRPRLQLVDTRQGKYEFNQIAKK